MSRLRLLVIILLCVCSVPAMAQLGAGSVGAAAKAAAVDENLNDTTQGSESTGQTQADGKTNGKDKELKKKIAFTGAGLLTVIIIASAAARRRKKAAGKVRDNFMQ